MTVSYTHPKYDDHVRKWELVRDVLTSNVKKYIKDVDINDPFRNGRYKDDAQFTNFTARTVSGLIGAMFRKDTIINLPESLEYMRKDSTGEELPLGKLAQEIAREALSFGRYGLLVDFPTLPEGASLTKAEAERLNARASILKYTPESIINWHTIDIGAKRVLDLIVLKENKDDIDPDDGFKWDSEIQYRVLRLIPNEDGYVYVQDIYNEKEEFVNRRVPKDKAGNPLQEIPFVFIGANDNDSKIDPSPILDLAKINIGHLRNSADYEESVHIVGQPTLFITSDMDVEQFKAANPNGVTIGSRQGVNLGTSGNANFLQANPNQLADRAMERKEMQAVMVGARLIVPQSNRETAEAARMRHSGETGILNTIAKNTEQALRKCLKIALKFMSDNISEDESQITLDINDIFFDPQIDPNFLMANIQLVKEGALSMTDLRSKLRNLGIIGPERKDEDIDADIRPENLENSEDTD